MPGAPKVSSNAEGPKGKSFREGRNFRDWLSHHHSSETELLVRLFKVHARDKGMTYADALDEALCFGWIDGVRKGGDDDSFTIRFTPRKAKSIWSKVNIDKVAALEAAGRMMAPGRAAFARREENRSAIYAYEKDSVALSPDYLKTFRTTRGAWKFFQAQAPWYRRTSVHWVMSAMREETRARRLGILISSSDRGVPIPSLDRTPKKK